MTLSCLLSAVTVSDVTHCQPLHFIACGFIRSPDPNRAGHAGCCLAITEYSRYLGDTGERRCARLLDCRFLDLTRHMLYLPNPSPRRT